MTEQKGIYSTSEAVRLYTTALYYSSIGQESIDDWKAALAACEAEGKTDYVDYCKMRIALLGGDNAE